MMELNDKLTQEAYDCHALKGKGLSRKEIAVRLGLSERQVKRRLASSFLRPRQQDDSISGIVEEVFFPSQSKIDTAKKYFSPIGGEKIVTGTIDASKLGIDVNKIPVGTITSGKITCNVTTKEMIVEDVYPAEWDEKDKTLFSYEEVDSNRESVQDYINKKYYGRKVKILNIADLHVPFTDYALVKEILKEHKDANILMINGDLLDLFAVSKFAKDKEIALRREIEEGREFLEYVAKRFEDVIITDGNHERRLRSFIKNMIPTDMQFLFPQDILKVTVSGEILKKKEIKNVKVVGSWWVKLFDVIYAHPDNFSAGNLKTVQNTSEMFLLNRGEYHRMCVIGHTHRAGWMMSGDVKLMETGCLCHDMDYHMSSKFTRARWHKAYSVAYIDEYGKVDHKNSTVVIAE